MVYLLIVSQNLFGFNLFVAKNKSLTERSSIRLLAAEEGFEPSQTESESVVLPLHNSAINSTLTIIAHAVRFVNSFFAIFDFYLKILCRNAEKGCLKTHSESLTAPEKPAELFPFTAGKSRCAAVGSLCQLTDNSVKKRSHFFR